MTNRASQKKDRRRTAVPRSIWALGFVSLLMDVSSEMIHSLLPVFMVSVLGLGAAAVGLVEGIADATTYITKLLSGRVSDRLRRRKPLAVFGYALAAATKPVFALAPSLGWLVAARFLDRLGKGIRGSPRDALIADVAPREVRGASFGLRQSLDSVGAVLGPLAALAIMAASSDDFRLVFWIAAVPGLLAVLLLAGAVREPEAKAQAAEETPTVLPGPEAKRLGRAFWTVTALGILFSLARFSEAFVLLRAQDLGLRPALVPLILVVLSAAYAVTAYPIGRLSDAIGRGGLLTGGFGALIAAHLLLGFADSLAAVYVGAALWGVHLGMTQGIFAALVADTAPRTLRGTAFGMFNMTSGLSLLVASVGAGILWDMIGPDIPFLAGAGLAFLALIGLIARAAAGRRRQVN